jgi:hypothetical protein
MTEVCALFKTNNMVNGGPRAALTNTHTVNMSNYTSQVNFYILNFNCKDFIYNFGPSVDDKEGCHYSAFFRTYFNFCTSKQSLKQVVSLFENSKMPIYNR